MTALLVALLLQSAYPRPPAPPAIFVLATLQEPHHLPSHRMGPHEGEEGALCYRGPTEHHADGRTFYNCPCQLVCEGMDIREQDDCVTSCSPNGQQCLCHIDGDACDEPLIGEPKKK